MSSQEAIHPTRESLYLGRGEERAYISSISDVVVGPRTTELQFQYEMPPQPARGKVRIWSGLTVDFTEAPFYEAALTSEKGVVQVSTPAHNFNQGACVVTVSVDEELHSIAATTPLLNGQPIGAGGSFIAVTAKASNHVSAVFSNPPNITAYKQADWGLIYEGAVPGQGTRVAEAAAPLDDTSGMITVNFQPGTLVSGKTYNVCLSVGPHLATFSAAYVFKYLLL